MKTKTLTAAILFALASFANLSAKPNNFLLENRYTTTSTVITEKMKINSKTQMPNQKNIYERNTDNKLVNKEVYLWDVSRGWVPSCKYQYHYTISGKLIKVEYSEWNTNENNWGNKNTKRY